MSRESLLIILGVLVALAPFSGLPMPWLSILLPLLGIAVLSVGFSLRGRIGSLKTSRTYEPSSV